MDCTSVSNVPSAPNQAVSAASTPAQPIPTAAATILCHCFGLLNKAQFRSPLVYLVEAVCVQIAKPPQIEYIEAAMALAVCFVTTVRMLNSTPCFSSS